MKFVSLRDKLVRNSTKLLIVVVGMMIILLGVFSTVVINNTFALLEEKITESLIRKGQLLTKNNRIALVGMVEDNAFNAVEDLVISTVKQDPNIDYGIFMDESMMVWINFSAEGEQKSQSFYIANDSLSIWANQVQTFDNRYIDEDSKIIEFAASVMTEGDRIGTIRYGLNSKSMLEELSQAKHEELNFLYMFLGFLMIAGVAIILFAKRLSIKQATTITEPLAQLTAAANTIAHGDYSKPVKLKSDDEIGVLAHDFDIMRKTVREYTIGLEEKVKERTSQLEEAQKEALDNAHKAGMADIATGVLHNVGNILNSVVTSANILHETIERSRINGFYKSVNLIKQNKENIGHFFSEDPRGKKLIDYMTLLETDLISEQDYMLGHAERLIEKIGTMAESISAQQEYANSANTRMLEPIMLEHMVKDALSMTSESLVKSNVKVFVDIDAETKIKAQKNKVIQIIVNLIVNAKEAMQDVNSDDRILRLSSEDKDNSVIFKATDNGHGISKDNIDKVFNHGFTTKSTGHGFGLHSSANYMTEMGGRMWAESRGEGKGATFVLEFPKAGKGEVAESETRNGNEQAIN